CWYLVQLSLRLMTFATTYYYFSRTTPPQGPGVSPSVLPNGHSPRPSFASTGSEFADLVLFGGYRAAHIGHHTAVQPVPALRRVPFPPPRDDDRRFLLTLTLQLRAQLVRIDIRPTHEDLQLADSSLLQSLAQLLDRHGIQHLEGPHARRNMIPRDIGQIRVHQPQPLPGREVAHQASANDRGIRLHDVAARLASACCDILLRKLGLPARHDVHTLVLATGSDRHRPARQSLTIPGFRGHQPGGQGTGLLGLTVHADDVHLTSPVLELCEIHARGKFHHQLVIGIGHHYIPDRRLHILEPVD